MYCTSTDGKGAATEGGGGYAGCPVSNTKIYLTEGGAIYNNTAASGSKDIYILSDTNQANWGAHAGNPEYYISQTMLGGVPYNWKDNNGNEIPLNKLQGTLMGDGVSLNLSTDAVADADTNNLAKVYITGNYSATRGGGIGTNGAVTIGTPPSAVEVKISKNWDDENNKAGKRPQSVIVELWQRIAGTMDDPIYIGYETITPDNAGDWSLTFTNLPKLDNAGKEYEYSIKERKIPGYTAEISGGATTGFQIMNSISLEDDPGIKRIPLKVNKVLKNGMLKGGEFIFQLRDKHGEVIAEATNGADGSVAFPDRTFSNEVTDWRYTIHEVKGNDANITYDETVYAVKISTYMAGDSLEATVYIEKNGMPYDGPITFTNCHGLPPTGDKTYQVIGVLLGLSLPMLMGVCFLWRKRESD